jgi:hypothetical protein
MQIEVLGTYCLYVARWIVLAVPGAWVLQGVRKILRQVPDGNNGRKGEKEENIVLAMLISQGILGALVFFIDKWIFR